MGQDDCLDRAAQVAMLIAQSRARLAVSARRIRESEQLVQHSARLVPQSAFDPPRPRLPDPVGEAIARRAREEQAWAEELRQIGCLLRSFVKEAVVASQETRWQARQSQVRSAEQQASSLRLKRLARKPTPVGN
jgi:hypothetical protein